MALTKVLIVDDHVEILRMYSNAFRLAGGFEVDTATNGAEGGSLVGIWEPDIILVDILMPEMNGLDMLEFLRSNPAVSKIPAIALTNLSGDTNIKAIMDKGAAACIIKSQTDPADVVRITRETLATSHKHQKEGHDTH